MLGSPTTGIDDAVIFFVYARNILQGHGAVYTVGQGHVEGFSSVLYLLLCVIAFAVSHAPHITPQMSLFALNLLFAILCSLAVLGVLNAVVDRLSLGNYVRILFAAAYLTWMLVNPLYFVWSVTTLMDTGVWSLVLTVNFALLAILAVRQQEPETRHAIAASALIVLTILARPEGQLWSIIAWLCFAVIAFAYCRSMRRALLRSAIPFAALLAVSLGLLIFRLWYFGYPLPNTYYAKVSANRLATLGDGRHYLHVFLGFYSAMLVVNIVLALVLAMRLIFNRSMRDPRFGLLAISSVYSIAALFVPVLEGGDHFSGFRMYQPLMPLLFLPALAWFFLLHKRPTTQRALFTAAAILLIITPASHSWGRLRESNQTDETHADDRMRIWDGFYLARLEEQNGERMRQLFPGGTVTQGVGAAGGFAFGYDGQTYDLLGLNDVRMAHADPIKKGPKDHQSFDARVFYQISPEMMLAWTSPQGIAISAPQRYGYYLDSNDWDYKIFKGIFKQPQFQREYVFAVITDDRHPGVPCMSFFRRDFIAKLLQNSHVHLDWSAGPIAASPSR
jgi:arabinofuranosyltransferase